MRAGGNAERVQVRAAGEQGLTKGADASGTEFDLVVRPG